MNALMSMGGYGWYVWPAYGITLFVFGFNIVSALLEKNRVKKTVGQFINRHEY